MGPEKGLPLPPGYSDEETYVSDLLCFVTSSQLLQTLVGGVHILDFLVNQPDLYERVIDSDWRSWFELLEIEDFLDFCLREDVEAILADPRAESWRGKPRPPDTLMQYLSRVRRLTLRRGFEDKGPFQEMPRSVRMGMNEKKMHEVDHFARYVERLTADLAADRKQRTTHLVDFGAGQGYLGRFLASQPWNRNVVALEGKTHNVENAKSLDEVAKLRKKDDVMRNKKIFRAERRAAWEANGKKRPAKPRTADQVPQPARMPRGPEGEAPADPVFATLETPVDGAGTVQHVEYRLQDGDLSAVVQGMDSNMPGVRDKELLVISLHSCGTLSHHALRSLVLNPAVKAVAVVGCCYNLMSERLSAPSYKMPSLRPQSQAASLAPGAEGDPHGFPMSARLCNYETAEGKGLQIPITARMMAVQAPANWGPDDSKDFFTRHFFRALLQRVFLDQGIVEAPSERDYEEGRCMIVGGRSPAGGGGHTQPIVIGTLGRKAYVDFVSYARAALAKLRQYEGTNGGNQFANAEELSDDAIREYARAFAPRKKHLSMVWTLMAFSAQLIEAVVIVDRWLWLREQEGVERCWVEAVFDYARSPRNLVVVGVKK